MLQLLKDNPMATGVILVVIVLIIIFVLTSTEKFEPTEASLADLLAANQQNEYALNRIVRNVAENAMPPMSENFAWDNVRRRGDDTDMSWSARIYSFMTGVPHDQTSEGVQHNAGMLSGYQQLTKKRAIQLCQNPCYWSGENTNNVGNCLCTGRSVSGVVGFGL